MAHIVVWSPRAIDDVDAIAAYIAEDSEAYAASVVRIILDKARRLSEFPYVGRVVPEFDDEGSERFSRTVTGSYIALRRMKLLLPQSFMVNAFWNWRSNRADEVILRHG